jgi:hypothetical protein
VYICAPEKMPDVFQSHSLVVIRGPIDVRKSTSGRGVFFTSSNSGNVQRRREIVGHFRELADDTASPSAVLRVHQEASVQCLDTVK